MSDAILLVGHGSVERAEDIPEFLGRIRAASPHAKSPMPEAVVAEVTRRFLAIGGSPLLTISRAQSAALGERLGVRVEVGMRLAPPFVADAVAALAREGVDRIVSLPLAPFSTHVYHPAVKEACAKHGVRFTPVGSWGTEPSLIDAFAETIREADAKDAHLVFTAHSLPLRALKMMADPYDREVEATAKAIALSLGRAEFTLAFQSQGLEGGEWLGPDLATTLRDLAKLGARAVLFSPIGFLSDHTEVLYDLDLEARAVAEGLGLAYHRAASLNVRPRFVETLATLARRALSESG